MAVERTNSLLSVLHPIRPRNAIRRGQLNGGARPLNVSFQLAIMTSSLTVQEPPHRTIACTKGLYAPHHCELLLYEVALNIAQYE